MSWDLIFQHLFIVLAASLLSIAVGLPLGIWAYVSKRARPVILRIVDLLQTIPSLALLGIIMVVLDPGKLTVIVGITLYSLLPIVRNTCIGLQEVDPGVIEAAVSMGAGTGTVIWKVMLAEARTSLLVGVTIAIGTILGYSAMAGTVGGGGLGDIAIQYGYYRYETEIMIVTVVVLVVLVQILQSIGMMVSRKLDKRK